MSFLSKVVFTEHKEVVIVMGFVALSTVDGYSVLPCIPSGSPPVQPGTGPYTVFKGAEKAIGAGTIITQPRTSTGVYTFTLDEHFKTMQGASILAHVNNTSVLFPKVIANVTGIQSSSSTQNNIQPGTDSTIATTTVIVKWYNTSNSLTNPSNDGTHAGGFWITLFLTR